MKKIIIIVAILVVSFFSVNEKVNAWLVPINNKTSLAVGKQYSGGESSISNATYAHSTYNSMGFSYKKLLTSPTYSNIQGNHNNGTPLLESGIIFLNGHASANGFNFENFMLLRADVHNPSSNIIGIGYYDNTKTGLFVMAGCNTAAGTENITKKAFNSGGKISIGWSTDLPMSSFTSWNERFHDEIEDKTTSVADAVTYANSFFYWFNDVKNVVKYGYYGYNPWYWIGANVSSNYLNDDISTNNRKKDNRSVYILNNFDETQDINKTIKNYIKDNIYSKFDENNYVLEINGVDEKYYDYVLTIDGIRTNLGYTAVVSKNNITIYDNMNELDTNIVISKIKKQEYLLENVNLNEIEINALLEYNEVSKNTINSIDKAIIGYDYSNDQLYYIINISSVLDDEYKYIDTIFYKF